MIRAVALGVVWLVGLGAIAAAAKKLSLPQPAEVIFPIAVGGKADRLPLEGRADTPAGAEKAVVAYAPPARVPSEPPAPQKAVSPPLPRIISRHWHDPHDRQHQETKQKASASKSPTKSSPDRAPKQVAAVKECRSDGLNPLLRKLNLSPKCA